MSENEPMGEWKRFGLQILVTLFCVFAAIGFAMFVSGAARRLGF